MNISNQISNLLSFPHFNVVIQKMDIVLKELGIPYYLIGASAMAIHMIEKGYAPSRGTKDIDFAIMISASTDYEIISTKLLEFDFRKTDEEYRFKYSDENVIVDVLPFAHTKQKFTSDFLERYTFLHSMGFEHIFDDAQLKKLDKNTVAIPPIEGIVLLKFIAWNNKPEWRTSDLEDILNIINIYFEFEFDDIVENHNDVFPDGELDQRLVAARVLGRKCKNWIELEQNLKLKIFEILESNLNNSSSPLVRNWAQKMDTTIVYARALLKDFFIGIKEN